MLISKSFLLQILLDDVKVSEHLLDLVLYLLIVLGGHIQVILCSLPCGLYLLVTLLTKTLIYDVGKQCLKPCTTFAFRISCLQSVFIDRMHFFSVARSCLRFSCSP